MLVLRCPTCNNFLGDIEYEYYIEKQKICDKNYDQIKIMNEIKKLIDDLFKKFEILPERYCCKMRLLTNVDKSQLII